MNERPNPMTSGAFWNSGKSKLIAIAAMAVIGAFVMYKATKSDPKKEEANAPKSDAVKALERMKDTHQKGLDQDSQGTREMKTPTDQPKGDAESTRLLADLEAKKELEETKRKSAEDAVRASLEYIQFQRKLQGLPYDQALAGAWEMRMEAAKSQGGLPLSPPPPPSKEAVQIVREKNPELARAMDNANSVTINVKGAQDLRKGGAVNASVQGTGGAGAQGATVGSGTVPDGIDPKTGLPRNAIAAGADPGGFMALLPDGTPDLEGGAVPVQVQYTPPGSSQPITITRWIRPGYLSGRSRPYDPRDLMMEDQAYRASMKAPTDLPEDKTSQGTKIPVRIGGAHTRVQNQDFVYRNRHVVVVPNPDAGGTK